MDAAESDVLADMSFPPAHRPKLHSTNPIERLNGAIKRRTEVVAASPTPRPSFASSALSSWSKTMNGPSNAPAT
jgi:transposase-like protein